jgi:hypothetical protein
MRLRTPLMLSFHVRPPNRLIIKSVALCCKKVADSCFEAREPHKYYVNIQFVPHTNAWFSVTKTKLLMKPKEVSVINFKNHKQHAYISIYIYIFF